MPLCPEIQLYLLDDDYPRGKLPQEEMLAILDAPSYWAFCWASGQVLAKFILANPALCAGKSVLDFGSGSGVAAIAAAKAGAGSVYACDIDEMSLDAIKANALLNHVAIRTCREFTEMCQKPDLIIAADVLYDAGNHHYLEEFPGLAGQVLISDSRMKSSEVTGYEVIEEFSACTLPDLEEYEQYNQVRIYYTGGVQA